MALDDSDGRALRLLLDMGRFCASQMDDDYSFPTVEESLAAGAAVPQHAGRLMQKMYDHWYTAAAGPCIRENAALGRRGRSAALLCCVYADQYQRHRRALHMLVAASTDGRPDMCTAPYLAAESRTGAAVLVKSCAEIPQPIYEVLGINIRHNLLRNARSCLGASSSLLPFMGDCSRRDGGWAAGTDGHRIHQRAGCPRRGRPARLPVIKALRRRTRRHRDCAAGWTARRSHIERYALRGDTLGGRKVSLCMPPPLAPPKTACEMLLLKLTI